VEIDLIARFIGGCEFLIDYIGDVNGGEGSEAGAEKPGGMMMESERLDNGEGQVPNGHEVRPQFGMSGAEMIEFDLPERLIQFGGFVQDGGIILGQVHHQEKFTQIMEETCEKGFIESAGQCTFLAGDASGKGARLERMLPETIKSLVRFFGGIAIIEGVSQKHKGTSHL
jgi:hypothetical protein